MEFIIITGMSGAGKSQAAKVLEDSGYYCIDNMPASLIPDFAELYSGAGRGKSVAFIIDVRGENDFNSMFASIDELKALGHACKIVFIDCSDEILINRYKETRRVHPLAPQNEMNIKEALSKERELLATVKERADFVINTTRTTTTQFRERLYTAIKKLEDAKILVSCMSFGFKYGAPNDSDLIFDVRCFPNPYYIPELKHKTGLDALVRDYVFSGEETEEFLKKLCDMIDFLLPLYVKEGKHHLTISIGCTGGKHRSVAITEALCKHLSDNSQRAVAFHRDINKE